MNTNRRTVFWVFGTIAIAAAAIAATREPEQPSNQPATEARLRDATVAKLVERDALQPTGPKSRYRGLLRQFAVPDDQQAYGDFCDFGYWSGTSYAGQQDLPAGYWVYVAPNWYIFKEEVSGPAPTPAKRAWGPEQATGAPDTWPNAGDIGTAWASRTPDGQPEWLELTYDAPVRPAAVLVYETYNPGAVNRVTGYDAQGNEVELWSGADPTPAGKDKGISIIPVHPEFDLSRIRIYVDSPKVPGWNEIDAVGLLDATGTTHWAASACASSSYADQAPLAPGVGGHPIDLLPLRELQSQER